MCTRYTCSTPSPLGKGLIRFFGKKKERGGAYGKLAYAGCQNSTRVRFKKYKGTQLNLLIINTLRTIIEVLRSFLTQNGILVQSSTPSTIYRVFAMGGPELLGKLCYTYSSFNIRH